MLSHELPVGFRGPYPHFRAGKLGGKVRAFRQHRTCGACSTAHVTSTSLCSISQHVVPCLGDAPDTNVSRCANVGTRLPSPYTMLHCTETSSQAQPGIATHSCEPVMMAACPLTPPIRLRSQEMHGNKTPGPGRHTTSPPHVIQSSRQWQCQRHRHTGTRSPRPKHHLSQAI